MREFEAAEYLGISARTLYRYRCAGKVPFRQLKHGPGRPVIDYDEQDLARLKAELERAVAEKSASPQQEPAHPRVSFRLSRKEHTELQQEAVRYSMSPAEYARSLVRIALESQLRAHTEALRGQVETTRTEMKRLRAQVSGALVVVLENMGFSPEDARQWVRENLQ